MRMTGFIGLGIMGKPMAANLLQKGGFSLLVNDVSEPAVQALEGLGARPASLREIGEECDVIFTNLPNGDIVQQVLFEENGVATFVRPEALVVDLSSVTPVQSQYCYRQLKGRGAHFLDAPVSGGEPKAIDGTLAFMVGGDEPAYQRAVPYFESMGAGWLRIGVSGSGSVAKLANQIIVNNTIAAVSEALVLASKAGADAGKVYQAIRGGLAGSAVLDAKAPLMLQHAFQPGGKISVNHKDIMNVMATAHELSVPLPLTSQLLEIMTALKASGNFEDDHAGIVQYYERLAEIEVG